MKKTLFRKISIVVLVGLIVALNAKSQEKPILNIGGDYTIFKGEYSNSRGKETYSSRGGLFVEKWFQLAKSAGNYLTPGLSYKKVNETYRGGGLGGGFSSKLDHYSFSGYVKFIHRFNIEALKPQAAYIGAMGGVQLYTWARGDAASHSVQYPEANWSDGKYTEEPSHLFKQVYYGFVAGFEISNKGMLRPSVEIRYMPRYGEYMETVLRPFELALNIAIGKKKE
jgi:hypothetical protein